MSGPIASNEAIRLSELYQLDILDTPKEAYFEALVDLGITSFDCAFCFLGFVDSERLWFKAKRGIEVPEVPRHLSICDKTIQFDEANVINDCRDHPDFKTNPLITGSPWVRAYLGVPVKSLNGNNVGTFCLLDVAPRKWSAADIKIAQSLATLVEHNLNERADHLHAAVHGMLHTDPTHQPNLASWKTATRSDFVSISPLLESWLCLSRSQEVSLQWFNQLPIEEDRARVAQARLETTGEPFRYCIKLPNGDLLELEEEVHEQQPETESSNGAGQSRRLLGLIKQVEAAKPATTGASASTMPKGQLQPRLQTLKELKQFPALFFRETPKGRVTLDAHGVIIGLSNASEQTITRVKNSENFLDLIAQETRQHFTDLLQGCLQKQTPVDTWVQLQLEENQPVWFHMELSPKKGFGAFKKPSVCCNFTAFVHKSTTANQTKFETQLLTLTGNVSKTGGWYYHLDTGALKTTDMLREVLGINREALSSVFHLSSLLSKLSERNIAVLFIECINNRKPASLEFQIRQQGVATRWLRMMIRPAIDEEGVPVGLYGVISDISEQRRIERVLETNTQTYNLIVDNLTDGLLEVDASLNLSFVNRNARNLFQKTKDTELHEAPLTALFPNLDPIEFKNLIETVNQTGVSDPLEFFDSHLNKWIWLRVFRSGAGYTVLLRDTTKRKSQISDLYMLNSAIEQVREVILVTNDIRNSKDPFGLLYLNSSFESFTGQSREKWLGRNPYHLVHGRIPSKHYRQLLVALLSHQKALVKTRYELSSGNKVNCDILVSPFVDTARNASCFLIVFRILDNPSN
jgi:PAS domain-containing protein